MQKRSNIAEASLALNRLSFHIGKEDKNVINREIGAIMHYLNIKRPWLPKNKEAKESEINMPREQLYETDDADINDEQTR